MDFNTLYNIDIVVDYIKYEEIGKDNVNPSTKYREQ